MNAIRRFFAIFNAKDTPKSDFSAFFRGASKEKQKERILEAVRKANKDQREIVEQYRKQYAKSAL
jgi:hypothetical protein